MLSDRLLCRISDLRRMRLGPSSHDFTDSSALLNLPPALLQRRTMNYRPASKRLDSLQWAISRSALISTPPIKTIPMSQAYRRKAHLLNIIETTYQALPCTAAVLIQVATGSGRSVGSGIPIGHDLVYRLPPPSSRRQYLTTIFIRGEKSSYIVLD